MNALNSNGASNTLFQHDRPNVPKRSKFDLSRLINFSIDTGMAVPFDFFPVLPNDSGYINIKMALDTLPLVQASLTNYKVLVHWYYMKNRDLWKGWKTFITKGRSGNIDLEIPKVDLSQPLATINHNFIDSDDSPRRCDVDVFAKSKHSLSSFFGVPSDIDGIPQTDPSGDNPFLHKDFLPYSFKCKLSASPELSNTQQKAINDFIDTGFNTINQVNALPFMMYQSIVKNNYVTPNLLQDNKALFPDEGDDDWLLPYTIAGNICNYVDGSSSLGSGDKVNYNGIYSSDETKVDLRLLRYGLFDDDYFTTGLPWLQRGDVTTTEFSGNINDFTLDDAVWELGNFPDNQFRMPVGARNGNDSTDFGTLDLNPDTESDEYNLKFNSGSYQSSHKAVQAYLSENNFEALLSTITSIKKTGMIKMTSELSANMLRNLLALSVWQERNARVDGSYNRMIFQHWAQDPHSEEHKPVYLGGTATYINFSTVLQNSESTNSSPLGATAGFGSASGSDNVCNFNVSDYGYIMGIMIIKPNTIYEQGIERTLVCENVFDDFIQPEFEGLSPQAILNKEIFVSGTSSDDDDLFAYQERNTSYKVRQNVNRGLFQCKPDKDILFGAFTQARWFENKPELSYQFCVLSPDNIRRDWLAYPVYPAFRCQLLSEVFVTRSLSYSSQPNTFGF